MFTIIGTVVLLVSVVILIAASAVVVPSLTFGVVVRLGNRSFDRNGANENDAFEKDAKTGKYKGRKLREGLHWIFPFIDKVKGYSADVDRAEFDHTVFTVDHEVLAIGTKSRVSTAVNVRGSVMYRPSFKRLMQFTNQSREVICKGILDEVKGELLVIGGQHEADDLIARKEAVDLLINCKLRLGDPPHIKWSSFMKDVENLGEKGKELDKEFKEFYEKNKNTIIDGDSIKPEHRIEFYTQKSAAMQRYLEQNGEAEMGELEREYGIEITSVAIAGIDFDSATRSAFQKQQQETAKMRAATVRHDSIMDRAKQIHEQSKGTMSWKDAQDQANITTGISPQTIVTGQGFGSGVMPIINLQAAASAAAAGPSSSEGKDKGKGKSKK